MGDCDSLKKHISDFLEGDLDQSSREEFERCLARDSELQKLTTQVGQITEIMGNLPAQKCSEDFSAKLRERIHRDEAPAKLPARPIRKYSLALSFPVIAVLAVFTYIEMFDTAPEDNLPSDPPMSRNAQPVATPIAPANQSENIHVAGHETDIKTKSEQEVLADSLRLKELEGKNPQIKYVDEKK